MRALFTPPVFADEEKTYTARLLYVILLITLASTLLFVVSLAILVPRNVLAQLPNTLVVCVLCAAMFFLVRRGLTRLASFLLISLIWTQSLTQAFLTGGIASPNFASHIAIILGAGLLLGTRAGVVTMGLSLMAGYGFARLLVDDYAPHLPAEAQRYVGQVRDGAQRMSQLIDDLLAFARLGRQALQFQSLTSADVAVLVQAVVDDLRTEAPDRPVDVLVADLPACQADPALLKQVFINLLSNAFKFSQTRAEARVEIGSVMRDGGSTYYVRDNGVGFDMRYVHKLFGVFQRLHSESEFEGTGVGLAIVQRIIHKHGGRIWAEAAVNHGTNFYFTLGKPSAS